MLPPMNFRPLVLALLAAPCVAAAQVVVPSMPDPVPTPHAVGSCDPKLCFVHAQAFFVQQLKLDEAGAQATPEAPTYEMNALERQAASQVAQSLVDALVYWHQLGIEARRSVSPGDTRGGDVSTSGTAPRGVRSGDPGGG